MTPDTGMEVWALARPLWVILVDHPTQTAATLLQAEDSGATYVLAFTTAERAAKTIAQLGETLAARPAPVEVGRTYDLVAALCRLGAAGIMVDFEPNERKCAWRRRLVAQA